MRTREVLHNVAIFRSGDYGDKGVYTSKDLQTLADAYNAGQHVAPVTIDHTQSGPKWGEVLKGTVRVAGNLLFADVALDPEFAPLVKRGAYENRSIELYRGQTPEGVDSPGNYYLRALTFLGAQPPEVKGLPLISMSEAAGVSINFSEDEPVSPSINLEIEAAVVRALNTPTAQRSIMDTEAIATKDEEIAALKAKIAEMEAATMAEPAPVAPEVTAAVAPEVTAAVAEKDAQLEQLRAEMAEMKSKMFSESVKTLNLPANIVGKLVSIRNGKSGVVTFSDKTKHTFDDAMLELARNVAAIAAVTTGPSITVGETQAAFSEGRQPGSNPDSIEFKEKALTDRVAAIRIKNPSMDPATAINQANNQLAKEGK